jgi:hypothetical protein
VTRRRGFFAALAGLFAAPKVAPAEMVTMTLRLDGAAVEAEVRDQVRALDAAIDQARELGLAVEKLERLQAYIGMPDDWAPKPATAAQLAWQREAQEAELEAERLGYITPRLCIAYGLPESAASGPDGRVTAIRSRCTASRISGMCDAQADLASNSTDASEASSRALSADLASATVNISSAIRRASGENSDLSVKPLISSSMVGVSNPMVDAPGSIPQRINPGALPAVPVGHLHALSIQSGLDTRNNGGSRT